MVVTIRLRLRPQAFAVGLLGGQDQSQIDLLQLLAICGRLCGQTWQTTTVSDALTELEIGLLDFMLELERVVLHGVVKV